MLPLSLEKIDEALLLELCEEGCPESQTLEFKRELPGKLDQDKHELCKDVVALANAEGGDLVYGIEEKDGVAGSIVGIITESSDAAIRRINQVLDAGIEPRIHGLRIQQIPVSEGYVLILRVPSSYDGPHCIRSNNKNRRFVMRNGTGVIDMSYDQIRGAFDRTATLAEQARRFIANRRELIAKGETPVPLRSGPKLVVHLVPIAGLAGRVTVDLKPIHESSYTDFFDSVGGGRCVFNLDGLVVHSDLLTEDGYRAYNQIFRNGILEGVILGSDVSEASQKLIHESSIVYPLYKSAKLFVEKVQSWSFAGPAILGLGILNVKGFELLINKSIGDPFRTSSVADRSDLVLPEEWIVDLAAVDIEVTIRSLLDTLWQAFGVEHCPYFDDATRKFESRQ